MLLPNQLMSPVPFDRVADVCHPALRYMKDHTSCYFTSQAPSCQINQFITNCFDKTQRSLDPFGGCRIQEIIRSGEKDERYIRQCAINLRRLQSHRTCVKLFSYHGLPHSDLPKETEKPSRVVHVERQAAGYPPALQRWTDQASHRDSAPSTPAGRVSHPSWKPAHCGGSKANSRFLPLPCAKNLRMI